MKEEVSNQLISKRLTFYDEIFTTLCNPNSMNYAQLLPSRTCAPIVVSLFDRRFDLVHSLDCDAVHRRGKLDPVRFRRYGRFVLRSDIDRRFHPDADTKPQFSYSGDDYPAGNRRAGLDGTCGGNPWDPSRRQLVSHSRSSRVQWISHSEMPRG